MLKKKNRTKSKTSVLLPKHVRAEKYQIHLEPDLENFTFAGKAQVALDIAKPSKEIRLHARDLEIARASIGADSLAQAISYDTEQETVSLHFAKPFHGKHTLNLEYSGAINGGLSGFYRSAYKVHDQTRYLATTQFEATDARSAFPCIDEPYQKAIFEFSFTIPDKHVVVSNTHPVKESAVQNGKRHVQFAPTPKMSPYLAAFIIGDLGYIEAKTNRGVQVRVYAVRGKEQLGAFALDIAVRGLEFDEQFFGIEYPLATLDLIALPDFASAAMENWGAITFRETALLIDEKHSSTATKQRCVEVILHELAHMWFGNLVTMQWWTHLWLNEGFATWMSFYAMDHLFPDWHIWTQFIADDYLVALKLDSLRATHPIEIPVHHPREIREIFDAISYRKGASVIRMIAEYLGDDKFRAGIRHYLAKHSYGNTETEDLWRALAEVSGEDVRGIMYAWTSKPGYPLLMLRKVTRGVEITQERFFASEREAKRKDSTLWKVPISMSVGSENNVVRLLLTKRKQIVAVDWEQYSWIKINFKSSTFCRTVYDDAFLNGIKEAKDRGQLKARDRIGIVSDLIAAARTGKISSKTMLDAMLWFRDENYYTIWSVLAGGIAALNRLLVRTELEHSFNALACDIFAPMAKRVGWSPKKGEAELEKLLRSLVLNKAGKYGVREVVEHARKLFALHVGGKAEIPADIRRAVYLTVAHHGSEKEYGQFEELLKKASLQEEENRLQQALVAFPSKKLINKSIKFIFSDKVRNHDRALLAESMIGSNLEAATELWPYLRTHWRKISSLKDSSALSHYGNMLEALLATLSDRKQLQQAEIFLKKNIWKGGERSVALGVEAAKANAAWKKRALNELAGYFRK